VTKPDIHWYCENIGKTPLKGGVIFLPGRTNYGYALLRQYTKVFDWTGVGLFATTPRIDQGWYPPPKGPQDQSEAVAGLNQSNRCIDTIINTVCKEHNLTRDKIIIAGFSMGAVAAVHWATKTMKPVAAVVCHSGAILEPWNVPKATHEMPIILNHGMDDYCFEWEERYMPMKRALLRRGYNAWFAEREEGNHHVHFGDVACCKDLFKNTFGIKLDWQPSWSDAA
jgi:predicted esterase